MSTSHKKKEIEITMRAAKNALNTYKKSLENGVDKFLEGEAIKPVFRKFN